MNASRHRLVAALLGALVSVGVLVDRVDGATVVIHNNSATSIQAVTYRNTGSCSKQAAVRTTSLIAAGGTDTYSSSFYDGYNVEGYFSVNGTGPDTNPLYDSGGFSSCDPAGASTTLDLYAYPIVDPTTNQCDVTICIRNNDVVSHTYSFYKGGSVYSSGGSQALFLAANQSGCATAQVACTNSTGFSLDYSLNEKTFGYAGLQGAQTNYAVSTNTTPSYPGSTNAFTPGDPFGYGGTGAFTNIVWAAGTTNAITSQQAGDSAVKAAVDTLAQSTARSLSNLQTSVDTGSSSTSTGLSNIVSQLRNMGTNGAGLNDAGITNAINTSRNVLSNLLAGIENNQTNAPNTNTFSIASEQTNAPAAKSRALTETSAALTGVDDITTAVGAEPSVLSGSGSAGPLEIHFVNGSSLNLDPEATAPGAMAMVKALITLVVSIGFAWRMVTLYLGVAKTLATAKVGTVPNINADFLGIGGNFAGVTMQLVVASAFLVLWTAALVVVSNYILGGAWDMASAKAAATGITVPPVTTYLMHSTIPVDTILSLSFTAILAHLTAAKAIITASAATRFLLG